MPESRGEEGAEIVPIRAVELLSRFRQVRRELPEIGDVRPDRVRRGALDALEMLGVCVDRVHAPMLRDTQVRRNKSSQGRSTT